MLDDMQDQIRAWLERKPAVSAAAILDRLKTAYPDRFTDDHLRTVQRAVKLWRGEQARRIVLESSSVIDAAVHPAQLAAPPPPAPPPACRPRGPSVDSVDDTLHPALGNIPG